MFQNHCHREGDRYADLLARQAAYIQSFPKKAVLLDPFGMRMQFYSC